VHGSRVNSLVVTEDLVCEADDEHGLVGVQVGGRGHQVVLQLLAEQRHLGVSGGSESRKMASDKACRCSMWARPLPSLHHTSLHHPQ
jgi:hypothetical protein